MTNNDIVIQPYLIRWGMAPTDAMLSAKEYSCPYCETFSHFCRGDFMRHAAVLWRQSVVGFTPIVGNSHAGIAVFRCQNKKCDNHFTLRLSGTMIEVYARDCPEWLKNSTASP